MLNCKNAKKINLLLYLEKNGFNPVKKNEYTAWFLSPFRDEKKASFKIDILKNVWYDHGEGIGGNIIDLVIKIKNCSTSEALSFINNNSAYLSFHKPFNPTKSNKKPNYKITKVGKIKHLNLISYIKQRKLNLDFTDKYCFQVHYSFGNEKEYYGIGFLNDSGGFEIRNKYFKGCLGKKNISSIKNNSNVVSIFESWSDFIAYLTFSKTIPHENFIILNSTALVKKAIDLISNYQKVKTYFDTDSSGKKTTQILKEHCKNEFIDGSILYENFKDFNDLLINKPKKLD